MSYNGGDILPLKTLSYVLPVASGVYCAVDSLFGQRKYNALIGWIDDELVDRLRAQTGAPGLPSLSSIH
jgi:hypothetical protein